MPNECKYQNTSGVHKTQIRQKRLSKAPGPVWGRVSRACAPPSIRGRPGHLPTACLWASPDGCHPGPIFPSQWRGGLEAPQLTFRSGVGRLLAQGPGCGWRNRPGLAGIHWFRVESAVAVAPGILPPELFHTRGIRKKTSAF